MLRVSGWRRLFRLVMFSVAGLCAQSGEWAQVQALVPGAQVEVRRYLGGGEVRGAVDSVSGDALVVRRKKDSVTVNRADFRRVRLRSNEETKTGRIIGTVILGGLGVIATGISDEVSAGGWSATVGIFAGVGYLIGSAFERPKRIVIYEARKS